MAVDVVKHQQLVTRKRKAHTKSRRGCGNCKLRRVKCDESKPRCKSCLAYGVSCNYDHKVDLSDLQMLGEKAFMIASPQRSACSLNQNILTMINSTLLGSQSTGFPETHTVLQLEINDLELLGRFQTRTVLTIGTAEGSPVYQNVFMNLACQHPFLMHIVLTLTLMHDRYLSTSTDAKRNTAEAFHWYRGTVLFNQKLSRGILLDERDAIWASSALLSVIATSDIDVRSPEEAWPLKQAEPTDLDWLKMSTGKKEIFKLISPWRVDGAIRSAIQVQENNTVPTYSPTLPELANLPYELIELCGLSLTSTPDNNPYHAPFLIVAGLVNVECNFSTIARFLTFIGFVQPEYILLIEKKDPRALLLLAYWWAMMCDYTHGWWMQSRARFGCQAICIYLEKYHAHEINAQKVLLLPRMKCGLDAAYVLD